MTQEMEMHYYLGLKQKCCEGRVMAVVQSKGDEYHCCYWCGVTATYLGNAWKEADKSLEKLKKHSQKARNPRI
jgi:hypothetical protein